jgi:hypothetical protein
MSETFSAKQWLNDSVINLALANMATRFDDVVVVDSLQQS